jgi:hypothetical protein
MFRNAAPAGRLNVLIFESVWMTMYTKLLARGTMFQIPHNHVY